MALIVPCLLLLSLSGVVSATPIVNGTLHGSVFFNESVPNANTLSLTWIFENTQIASKFPNSPPGCIPQYEGRCQMFENGSLILSNLTSVDEGGYTFNAVEPPSKPIKTVPYDLRVYPILSIPLLTNNATSGHLISGSYVSLHCDAGSQTVTTYTFYQNGKNICSEPQGAVCSDSRLYFQPITESDSGNYTCTIQNPISSNTSNSLELTVSVPVSDVNLTSNASGLVWPGQDSVSLTCSARGTNVSYSWNLQGAPLPPDHKYQLTDNNRVLTIHLISDTDNGTFTCTATNWINNQTSNEVKLKLGSRVSEVTLTSNYTSGSLIWAEEQWVSLQCSANGSAVRFLWKLNGELLPNDSRYHLSEGVSPPHANLLISPVSRNDAGNFTCEARNPISNMTTNPLSFNLAWAPEGSINCTVVPTGQNVELGCSWPGGQPAANVSLRFSDITKDGQNSVTTIVSTGNNLHGTSLNCNGDQLGRTSQCSVKFEFPMAPDHKNDTISSSVGGTVVLRVILVPGLPAEFTWYRLNPDPIEIKSTREILMENNSSSSTLQIKGATEKDAGKYECRATNIIGTQSFFFTVSVKEGGLGGGEIAGIVIGVLAGVALIAILVFFIVKKKKRSGDNESITTFGDQLGVTNPLGGKQNGGMQETSLSNNEGDQDDVKYAVLKFPNNNSKSNPTQPTETEYSTVKTSIK